MKSHVLAAPLVRALALTLCCACSSTGDSTDTTAPSHPNASRSGTGETAAMMSEEEAMARMMELATPGPEHAELAAHAGTWTVQYKYRWSPDAPWESAAGSVTSKPVLGGRYLMEEHSMEMMGMPMQGLLFLGFDKQSGEYTSLWMDSNSTWWVEARGKESPDGVTNLTGTMKDIAGERPYRMKTWTKADGTVENEMYDTIGGREVLVMTYTLQRKS